MADGSAGPQDHVSKQHAQNATKIYEELVKTIKDDMKSNPTVYAADDRADSLFPERIAGDLIAKLMAGKLRYTNNVVVRALIRFELNNFTLTEMNGFNQIGHLDRIHMHVGQKGPNQVQDIRKGCL